MNTRTLIASIAEMVLVTAISVGIALAGAYLIFKPPYTVQDRIYAAFVVCVALGTLFNRSWSKLFAALGAPEVTVDIPETPATPGALSVTATATTAPEKEQIQ